MRCINKTVLLQQLSACPSNEISENRMHFWITMFGHEVVHPKSENEENSTFKEEINKCSVDSFLYQKIRPKYSEEWIKKLNNL